MPKEKSPTVTTEQAVVPQEKPHAENRGYWGYREMSDQELADADAGSCGCGE